MYTRSALTGIAAVIISVTTILSMAELRPDYNHLHKAISELGTVDAPNKWIFNLFGYFLPGLGIAYFAYYLRKQFSTIAGIRSYPFYLLVLSGLLLSLAGIFPGDMDHKGSFTTIMHLTGSFGGGLAWLICTLTVWWQLKKDSGWKIVAIVSFTVPFITIALMMLVPESAPGLAQRIGFAGHYGFILLLAGKQWRTSSSLR